MCIPRVGVPKATERQRPPGERGRTSAPWPEDDPAFRDRAGPPGRRAGGPAGRRGGAAVRVNVASPGSTGLRGDTARADPWAGRVRGTGPRYVDDPEVRGALARRSGEPLGGAPDPEDVEPRRNRAGLQRTAPPRCPTPSRTERMSASRGSPLGLFWDFWPGTESLSDRHVTRSSIGKMSARTDPRRSWSERVSRLVFLHAETRSVERAPSRPRQPAHPGDQPPADCGPVSLLRSKPFGWIHTLRTLPRPSGRLPVHPFGSLLCAEFRLV